MNGSHLHEEKLKKDDNLTVKITHLNRYGQGVAALGTEKIIIPLVIPGETVRIQIRRQDAKGAHADLLEVIESSPERQAAPCPVFGLCGGCDFQHMSYESQLVFKEQAARKLFSDVMPEKFFPIEAAPSPWNYRNRVTLHRKGDVVGFVGRDHSKIIAVKECMIASQDVNGKFAKISARDFSNDLEKIEIREDHGLSFVQVNSAVNDILVQKIKSILAGPKNRSLLELYAGRGNFTRAVAPSFRKITAVEKDEAAVTMAIQELKTLGFGFVDFVAKSAAVAVGDALADLQTYDIVLADPPRAGLGALASDVIRLRPKKIVVISCDPAALVRDAKIFVRHHYRFSELHLLDMFPQTHHYEALGVFLLG